MMLRPRHIAALLTAFTALMINAPEVNAQQGSSLAFQRAEHLRRGINLSMWYSQTKDFSGQRLDTYTTAADFTYVKSLGFDHVRLPIDPEAFIADSTSGSLRPDMIARLDKTVAAITNTGLNVILDVHPEEEFQDATRQSRRRPRTLLRLLDHLRAALHEHQSRSCLLRNPERAHPRRSLPLAGDPGARGRTHSGSRAAPHVDRDPRPKYSKIDTLLAMEPIRDENIIYTFHEYDPMLVHTSGRQLGHAGVGYAAGRALSLDAGERAGGPWAGARRPGPA